MRVPDNAHIEYAARLREAAARLGGYEALVTRLDAALAMARAGGGDVKRVRSQPAQGSAGETTAAADRTAERTCQSAMMLGRNHNDHR